MKTSILQQNNSLNSPVYATNKIPTNTSDKYKFLSSDNIKQFFESKGFELEGISQVNPRKQENIGYQKHLMVFSKESLKIDDDNRLQILVKNSHSGGCLELSLGVFRLVCANSIISGETMHTQKIRHQGKMIHEKLERSLFHIVAHADELKEHVTKMKNTQLTYTQINKLVESAKNLRLKDVKNIVSVDNATVTKIRRDADKPTDLYTVFNVIQESVIRGGIEYKTEKDIKDINGKVIDTKILNRKTRGITNIDRSLELNRSLWSSAMDLLKVAA